MIVWPNSPFGDGRTTLAAGLCRALPAHAEYLTGAHVPVP